MSRLWHALLVIQLIIAAVATVFFLSLALVDPPPARPPFAKGHRL